MGNTMDYESSEIRIRNWMDQYGDALLKVCIVYLTDYGLAEDAVQDTFLNAWRFMDRFEGRNGCSEKTWLTSIAVNVCRSYRRTKWFQIPSMCARRCRHRIAGHGQRWFSHGDGSYGSNRLAEAGYPDLSRAHVIQPRSIRGDDECSTGMGWRLLSCLHPGRV